MMKTMSFKTFTSGEEQQGHKRQGYFQGNWALQLSDYFTMFILRVKCEMKKSNMNPT